MNDRNRRHTDRVPAGLLIVNVTDRVLFVLLLTTIFVTCIGWGSVGFVAITNTNKISRQNDRLARREYVDTRRLRAAAARICARENLVRAEAHYVYRMFHITTALRRVRHTLPVLDCAPNLTGESARPLSPAGQACFVKVYAAGELKAVPQAADVEHGPDENCP